MFLDYVVSAFFLIHSVLNAHLCSSGSGGGCVKEVQCEGHYFIECAWIHVFMYLRSKQFKLTLSECWALQIVSQLWLGKSAIRDEWTKKWNSIRLINCPDYLEQWTFIFIQYTEIEFTVVIRRKCDETFEKRMRRRKKKSKKDFQCECRAKQVACTETGAHCQRKSCAVLLLDHKLVQ